MKRILVIVLCLIYALFMAALSIYYKNTGESFKSLVAASGIASGALPLLLGFFTKFKFNLPIVASYLIFLFGSQYLGSILGWYGLGWWDILMHFISGGLLAFLGIALYERMAHRNAGSQISSWFIFLFTFSFAVLGGVIWEIYEFSGDQFFDMTLQGGGNKDTMVDLIADAVGGFLIAFWAGIRTKIKK
ncbi:hypothetical protein J7E71_05550 [Mesobacillus foraminis]|uniref:hypothetical protein n=1 Tax=Mesobacillus foraminis TaxID=279826 RepID=UPI001BEBF1DA|nr:hypothetical protein [Mesobacillus foraminis]MBT2755423.1 hypothetical protein [Mesobacillus foraminis]